MHPNTFGNIYKLHSFGESHGKAMGGIVDGVPAGFKLDIELIQNEIYRRSTSQAAYSSKRKELDKLQILSGVFDGKTLGTPIGFIIENTDAKSKDYSNIKNIYRPSHADYTWEAKYGIRDYRGGGRSSARETISRVVAGAIAKQYLNEKGINIIAWVEQIGNEKWVNDYIPDINKVDSSELRCPDISTTNKMKRLIVDTAKKGDTLGGVIKCSITNLPPGIGEPVFNKLHAALGNAMLGINAVKGFEYGSGFHSAAMTGTENNDLFFIDDNKIRTKTNNSGGVQGGISNGEEIYFKVAFKPVASISSYQQSVDNVGNSVGVKIEGRHDVCVVPRAVPIVEAMAAMVILDFCLMQKINKL